MIPSNYREHASIGNSTPRLSSGVRQGARLRHGRPGMINTSSDVKAFTLMEILVSTVLLSFLTVLLFSILNTISTTVIEETNRMRNYQDSRIAMDQISRELQQTIPGFYGPVGNFNHIFQASTNGAACQLHWIAVIDNPVGHEEVEVHYYYDGTNTLYKSLIFAGYGGPIDSTRWDFNTSPTWHQTPPLPTGESITNRYSPILTGVKSMSYELWRLGTYPTSAGTNNPPSDLEWPGTDLLTRTNFVPAFVRVKLQVFDQQIVRKFGTAAAIPEAMTNQARNYTIMVNIPRSEDPLP